MRTFPKIMIMLSLLLSVIVVTDYMITEVFDNGLDLRNKYLHGTQKLDEYSNNQDYYIFLRILILIVIKINEEFCLKYSTEK